MALEQFGVWAYDLEAKTASDGVHTIAIHDRGDGSYDLDVPNHLPIEEVRLIGNEVIQGWDVLCARLMA